MDFAAHSREEARATIEAAKVTNTMCSGVAVLVADLVTQLPELVNLAA